MLTGKLNYIRTNPKSILVAWTLLLLYAAGILYYLFFFFSPAFETYIGLLMAPYVLVLRKDKHSFRYSIPALFFITVLFLVPVKTVFFLSVIFGMLFLAETCLGKINNAFFILLLLLSPIFSYLKATTGFPIRLWLSKLSGEIFSLMGKKAEVMGNIIMLDGNEFSVDPACAGLQMLTVSLLIALLVISHYERRKTKPVSMLLCVMILAGTFVLNILCNLFRIILLITFNIMPGNIFHDVIGMLCLIIYVIIPLMVFSKYILKPGSKQKATTGTLSFSTIRLALNIPIFIAIAIGTGRVTSYTESFSGGNSTDIPGFTKEVLSTGILKFESDKALVYMKPLNFYSVEHSPMICWTGSGYEFKQINKEIVGGREVYTGTMEKGNDKIYAAWWFDGGNCKTINQFEWRWKAAKGKTDFCLFNVNASNKKDLISQAKRFLEQPLN